MAGMNTPHAYPRQSCCKRNRTRRLSGYEILCFDFDVDYTELGSLLAFLASELIAAIRASNSSSVSSILLFTIPTGLLIFHTGKAPTHPQSKSLPWIPTCKTGQLNSFDVNLRDLQAPTGYLKRPMTQPKGSVSLRRIFPMTAIALFKAWIAFRANEW